jgi:bromodomain adjacent to zinc finger domain protein 1A
VSPVDLGVGETGGSVTSEEAIRSATAAANWSQKYQGCSLGKLSLDSVTLSEVLRLHLLSSGGRCTEANSNWR